MLLRVLAWAQRLLVSWAPPGRPCPTPHGVCARVRGSARAPPRTRPGGALRRRRPQPVAKVRLRKRGHSGRAKEEVGGGAGAGGLRGRADAMGRLHCTQDPVPEAVGGDMQQLNQLSAQVGPAAAARGRGGSGGGEEG